MVIEIKHRDTGHVILTVESDSLIEADLRKKDLSGAELAGMSLEASLLSGAILRGANLAQANLDGTDLTYTDLSGANLEEASLQSAALPYSILSNANFTNANLMYANLSFTELEGADLTCAILGYTQFYQANDLHRVLGLDQVNHVEPSQLDDHVLRQSLTRLPEEFVKGCGHSDDSLRELYRRFGNYRSCFLSYARDDSEFTNRLIVSLQNEHVPYWWDQGDSSSGESWREEINRALRSLDKVLLICSRQSLSRPFVTEEIFTTLQIERESGQRKLIPVDTDGYLLSEEMTEAAQEDSAGVGWNYERLASVRAHQTASFKGWQEETVYQKAIRKLLRDLKRV